MAVLHSDVWIRYRLRRRSFHRVRSDQSSRAGGASDLGAWRSSFGAIDVTEM